MNANATAPDLYPQTLPAKDGWAASGTGTTGGSKADTTPRIIKVRGTIDADTDDSGRKLTCADYAKGTGS